MTTTTTEQTSGTQTPIEIACNGNHCEEAAPQG